MVNTFKWLRSALIVCGVLVLLWLIFWIESMPDRMIQNMLQQKLTLAPPHTCVIQGDAQGEIRWLTAPIPDGIEFGKDVPLKAVIYPYEQKYKDCAKTITST